MADRPILFSGPMVRAIIDGRKKQTRRVITKRAADNALAVFGPSVLLLRGNVDLIGYAPGDRLWVRETFAQSGAGWPSIIRGLGKLHYRADPDHGWHDYWGRWRPSIHMPRWASRLTLIVTDVRVQRLHDISEADAQAEGADLDRGDGRLSPTYRIAFSNLWDSLNAKRGYGWDANPWVCAITFEAHRCNIDQMPTSPQGGW